MIEWLNRCVIHFTRNRYFFTYCYTYTHLNSKTDKFWWVLIIDLSFSLFSLFSLFPLFPLFPFFPSLHCCSDTEKLYWHKLVSLRRTCIERSSLHFYRYVLITVTMFRLGKRGVKINHSLNTTRTNIYHKNYSCISFSKELDNSNNCIQSDTISKIAHLDWPEHWPTLFDSLMVLLKSNNTHQGIPFTPR